ncbi:hypothetical protein AB1Y20_002394 [Prymnesium parvum]|uniref:DIRP domain-containing protein n=1 Tax=Prymnesium parvum TaxID=97485 RepID=A0AB34JAY3_PRYPA
MEQHSPSDDKRRTPRRSTSGRAVFRRAADLAYEAAADASAKQAVTRRTGKPSKSSTPLSQERSGSKRATPAPEAEAAAREEERHKRQRGTDELSAVSPVAARRGMGDGDARAGEEEVTATDECPSSLAKRRRAREKKQDEGDWKELKPRHLKGKRREELVRRQVANAEAAAERRGQGSPEHTDGKAVLRARLSRLLRPKLRRWCMYEWFYSPVDHGWYHQDEFRRMLQDAGLGHVAYLSRVEWAYVRMLLASTRRFSPNFIAKEREKLHRYRDQIRSLRRGNTTVAQVAEAEAALGLHCSTQMAVGQRVTAFHPKERHLFTGTVLTPDGDHYKIQFDKPRHGVQLVRDIFVSPLLDGSRGIDFTSPRSIAPIDAPTSKSWVGSAHDARSSVPQQGGVGATGEELALVAKILRFLKRKKIIMAELHAVATEAEGELKRLGLFVKEATSQLACPGISADELEPPPIKLEVTAAQQRMLGQVPTPPSLPLLAPLLAQLWRHGPEHARGLEERVAMWREEMEWLQAELRATSAALDAALHALRPIAQRLSLALGAAAPEPASSGLGLAKCCQLNEEAAAEAAAIVSQIIAESRPQLGTDPPRPMRDFMSAAAALLLKLQAWAEAPISQSESRLSLVAALHKLKPSTEANYKLFEQIEAATIQVHALMCGATDQQRGI